jgi:siroheme synthase
VASAFLVIAGHGREALDRTLDGVRPDSVTLVVMMGLASRVTIAEALGAHGWSSALPAAIVCAASTPAAWTWTGTLRDVGQASPPEGMAGVLVVGEVVSIREALLAASVRPEAATDEVKYGRNR